MAELLSNREREPGLRIHTGLGGMQTPAARDESETTEGVWLEEVE